MVKLQNLFCNTLQSILLAIVQSLDNKPDDLRSRMAFQGDTKDCNVMVFMEIWLGPSIPDLAWGSPFTARTE